MKQEIIEKYAQVMVWALETSRKTAGGNFAKDDIVRVVCALPTIKLAEAIQKIILQKGWHPIIRLGQTPTMDFDFYNLAKENHLTFLGPWEKTFFNNMNGHIGLRAPTSLTHLKDIDPQKFATEAKARKILKKIMNKREEQGLFGWTICTMPTPALAKQAKMTLAEYENEIIKACYLDKADPIAEWEKTYRQMEEIKTWLKSLNPRYFFVESENVGLKIRVGEKRKWRSGSGCNMPSFELFLSPDWREASGAYYANMPSFVSGNYVRGAKLVFRKGRAIKITAEEGEEFTKKYLATDKGACQIGEFSLTDKRHSPISKFMANTLFDENVGQPNGNCHIAVGASYTDTFDGRPKDLTKKAKKELGFNDSAIHWDLVNTESKRVTAIGADGHRTVIYEDGMFKY